MELAISKKKVFKLSYEIDTVLIFVHVIGHFSHLHKAVHCSPAFFALEVGITSLLAAT